MVGLKIGLGIVGGLLVLILFVWGLKRVLRGK